MSAAADLAQLRLIQLALPAGGCVLNLVEGYFDESAAGLGQTIFTLGGYLVKSEAAPAMTEAWRAALDNRGISTFHMKDCAPGNGEFASLNQDQRSDLVRDLIDIIHNNVVAGVTSSVNIKQYEKNPLIGELSGIVPNYFQVATFMLLQTCEQILHAEGIDSPILYNFEAGNNFVGACTSIIDASVNLNAFPKYAGHAFLPRKNGPALLQAADLLVWLTTKNFKNMVIGRNPRKDSLALRRIKHWETTFFVKDNGDIVMATANPYNQSGIDYEASNFNLIQLHSGKTPPLQLPGWDFDPKTGQWTQLLGDRLA